MRIKRIQVMPKANTDVLVGHGSIMVIVLSEIEKCSYEIVR